MTKRHDKTNLFHLLCTTQIIYTKALSLERKRPFFFFSDEEKSNLILNKGFHLKLFKSWANIFAVNICSTEEPANSNQ